MRLAGEKGEGALAWKLHLLSGEGGGEGKMGSFCMAFHCIHSSATCIRQHGKKTLLFFVHILPVWENGAGQIGRKWNE